jgi:hypothetical protein
MAFRPKPVPLPRPKPAPTRVQVYLSGPALGAALAREARLQKISLSQAASNLLERGLAGRIEADPDDRLLRLERRLSDHMRLSARDMMILEELMFLTARAIFARLPEDPGDQDPVYRASIEVKLEGLLDEVATRIARSRNVSALGALNPDTPAQTKIGAPTDQGGQTMPRPANDRPIRTSAVKTPKENSPLQSDTEPNQPGLDL